MSRDVMRRLAEARPAELDPDAPVDPGTRSAELARAMSSVRARAGDRRMIPVRRRPATIWGGGLGLVGTAAAAALVIASGSGAPEPGSGGNGTAGSLDVTSTRTVLLAAADKAETAPATGAYWRVKTMHFEPVKVGPKSQPYTVEDARITEEWTGRNGDTWYGRRTAGARPKTARDKVAWRRDGSPTRWDLGPRLKMDRKRVHVSTKPGDGVIVKGKGLTYRRVPIAGSNPSLADLRKLPTDPAALRKLAEQRAHIGGEDAPLQVDNAQVRQAHAAGRLIDLLTTAPVSSKVRAAAFRALADMPVVKSDGRAVDGRGRSGVALSIVTPNANGPTRTRLIIDPATSQVLSENMVTKPEADAVPGKQRTTLYLGAGWTDQTPQPPTLP